MRRRGEDHETAGRRIWVQVERSVRAFLPRIRVARYVRPIGKTPPNNALDFYFFSYFFSARDMARFGIQRVHAAPGHVHTGVSRLDVCITYVEPEEPPPQSKPSVMVRPLENAPSLSFMS